MNCPFCKNSLTNEIDKLEKNCPFCKRDIYDEIHSNFKKLADFNGKFIRVNHENKSFPFIKAYFPGKQNDFFCERGTAISVGDTIDLNNLRYKVTNVLPFFNQKFNFAVLVKTEIIRGD